MDLSKLSEKEQEEMYRQLQSVQNEKLIKRQKAYLDLKFDYINAVRKKVEKYVNDGVELKKWLREESTAFMNILNEYGHAKRDDQLGFTTDNGEFRIQVKGNKVKKFDERADVASKRLIEFLNGWIKDKASGDQDPVYSLAMTMLQRNEMGELDNKSISKLYSLEDKFNSPEYTEIMHLFKESNVIEGIAIGFYFEKKNLETESWQKLEPSFNKL